MPLATSGLAVASLVLSILWLGGLGSILAVIFALVALSQIRSAQNRIGGKGLAIAGLVIGAVGVIGAIGLVVSLTVVTAHSISTLPTRRSIVPTSTVPGSADAISPHDTPASATIVNTVTGVPNSVAAAVGLPSTSTVAPPMVKMGQPPLTIDGKPGAVFIAGEFCAYCAAERWAMVMAFSKFGTFSNLKETLSSPWDAYPSTATFSFYGAYYSSSYLTLDMSEHESNDTSGLDTRTTLQPLTPLEAALWSKYDSPEGFPFLDIGNKSFVLSPSYDPAVLSGLDQEDIASKLKNPKDLVTQDIVGTSNYLTASICAATDQKPSSVCSGPTIKQASHAMGLN